MQDAKLMVRGPDGEWMEVSGNGDEIREEIEAARKEIGEAVDSAHSEADRAQQYADDCLGSASDAHKSAEIAQFYGQDANQSAETANRAAQTAREAANRAEAAADELGTVLSGGEDGKFLGHADGKPQWVDAPAGGSGGASTEALEAAIARHNASGSAHQDIRALISEGFSIKNAYVNDSYQLVIERTDGSGYVSGSLRGPTGPIGPRGPEGPIGATGATPVRGTDYWTEADQESIVQQVIEILGGGGPIIIKQPVDVEAAVGETIQFTVKAIGEGLKFQWVNQIIGKETWGNSTLIGNNTATIAISVVEYSYNYLWRCVITDENGNEVTTKSVKIVRPPETADT